MNGDHNRLSLPLMITLVLVIVIVGALVYWL
jgi:hypothetical protein